MIKMPHEITNFFLAMQAGPHGIECLKSMFADNATYSEPFSGQSDPHTGREAIAAAFTSSRSDAFDDAVIQIGEVQIVGETISVQWTCISKAIPGGRGSGTNVFTVKDGMIQSLVTTLDAEANP